MTHTVQQPREGVWLRRADNNERFVAFAFAAADLVVETEAGGLITYAAGAFRTRLGQQADAFVSRPIQEIVDPKDHGVLEAALLLVAEKGRLLPLTIRLANASRTQLALAGIRLAATGRPLRLCLTFAVPPTPIEVASSVAPYAFARAAEARLRTGALNDIGLLEISSGEISPSSGESVGLALQRVAPDVLASEIAPGRFGLLGATGGAAGLVAIASSLEAALRLQGVDVAVASHHLPVALEGLTAMQAARALRQALTVFARDGVSGLSSAGFAGGLAGYLSRAAVHAAALRQVIRNRRFNLLFQPIVSLSARSLHHYEALIRPKPLPGCAFDTPQEFVMLVEALGLAAELDLAVAGLASDAAAFSAVPIAFNVSGQSLQNAAFLDRLLALLSASPSLRAGRMIVEMTETAEVENIAEVRRAAEALRAIGVPFCLDDYGAGAADMRLLRALPADMVKLDGSYVSGVVRQGRERGFVTGMVDIARAVGAAVVAERIETEVEAEALLAVGATYGQGWLFGRPAPLPTPRPMTLSQVRSTPHRRTVKESQQ